MRNIKIIMHTHWDREWYFTKEETKVLLKNHLIETIKFLEENTDLVYILDGQSVMIDDFLEFAPEYKTRLTNLIQKSQIKIGPWYTQSDLMIVSGESIIRNLYYGFEVASKYGDVMKVGYAPDTFGHSAQMPQIYRLFGIESTVFWRGFSEHHAKKSDFIWEGLDGSQVYGVNLATGYQGAKYLESNKNDLKERMDKILKVIDKYSASNSRLIMNGHDQMPIQKNIKEIINSLQEFYKDDVINVTTFESYIEDIKKVELEIVKGELIHSKHSRIHKTINSTRMDLKLLNAHAESKIYNILEPLAIIGTKIDIDYPHKLIEKCLKELFGIHAHDSLGGCNSDKVNRDIQSRLFSVHELLDTQIELYQRKISIASRIKNVLTIYNLLPYVRYENICEVTVLTTKKNFEIYENSNKIEFTIIEQKAVDAGLIDRQVAAKLLNITMFETKINIIIDKIDGLSVKYLHIIENDNSILKKENDFLENEHYQISIKNNQLNIFDKIKNENYKNIISIENSGDAGDSYDYSPPLKDLLINENIFENVKYLNNIMIFDILMKVPKNSLERERCILSSEVVFNLTLTLNKNIIHLKVNHTNICEDSRFRITFDPKIITDKVVIDSHLSTITKPTKSAELEFWEEEKWVEKPVSIETFQSFISLKNEFKEANFYAFGLKEYEVDNKVHITLFRTFSHLGKSNLVNRPGRPSGIEIKTIDNQLINSKFDFDFGLSLHDDLNPSLTSKNLFSKVLGYHLKQFNRFNINEDENKIIENKINLEINPCVISSIKLSKNDDIFIRLFNPTEEEVHLNLEGYYSDVFEVKKSKFKNLIVHKQEILNIIIEEKKNGEF